MAVPNTGEGRVGNKKAGDEGSRRDEATVNVDGWKFAVTVGLFTCAYVNCIVDAAASLSTILSPDEATCSRPISHLCCIDSDRILLLSSNLNLNF